MMFPIAIYPPGIQDVIHRAIALGIDPETIELRTEYTVADLNNDMTEAGITQEKALSIIKEQLG